MEGSKIKRETTDKQTSREFWRAKEIAWCGHISITVIWYYNSSMCLIDCPWYLATEIDRLLLVEIKFDDITT